MLNVNNINNNNNVLNNRNWNGQGNWQNNNWHGAHNYVEQHHYTNWHHGSWNNWYQHPAAWYGAGMATGWLASPGDAYVYSNPFYAGSKNLSYNVAPTDLSYNYVDYSQPLPLPPQQVAATYGDSSYTAGYDPGAASNPAGTDAVADAGPPPADAAAPVDDGAPPEAFQRFDEARAAFKANDYGKALTSVDKAIKLLPSDAAMHEFRALVLFAQHKYRDAVPLGFYMPCCRRAPEWTWDTVRDLYADPETFTRQLRALEKFARENPKASEGHFLLAYEYLVMNYVPQALTQLQQFEALVPEDKLAPQLISAFTPRSSSQASADSQTSPPGQP